MPFDFQIAVDSAEPHVLADWWAETLGWVVEPSDEAFMRKMIAAGYATDEETITRNGTLVWRTGAAIRHPNELTGGTMPRILFQLVPDGKSCGVRSFHGRVLTASVGGGGRDVQT